MIVGFTSPFECGRIFKVSLKRCFCPIVSPASLHADSKHEPSLLKDDDNLVQLFYIFNYIMKNFEERSKSSPSPNSLEVEHQSCKLEVLSSILSLGSSFFLRQLSSTRSLTTRYGNILIHARVPPAILCDKQFYKVVPSPSPKK